VAAHPRESSFLPVPRNFVPLLLGPLDSPHASPFTRPTTLGCSHTALAAHARITILGDFIRRRASPLFLPTARMTARAWSRTRRQWRRRCEVRTRFDATRRPGGSCEHSARRYPPSAKPLPADGASGLRAAASAPRIPTPRRVLVECDQLAFLQVFTNASADGALRFLVVDEITISIECLGSFGTEREKTTLRRSARRKIIGKRVPVALALAFAICTSPPGSRPLAPASETPALSGGARYSSQCSSRRACRRES
jgi:hypothetical protein